jgi:4-oxalocrotonate tautomerase
MMPYINIKITDEKVTAEQKSALIEGATQLLVDVLGKNPATTVVVIDEVNTDNWGVGGKVVSEIRQQAAALTKAAQVDEEHPAELHETGGLMAWPEKE